MEDTNEIQKTRIEDPKKCQCSPNCDVPSKKGKHFAHGHHKAMIESAAQLRKDYGSLQEDMDALIEKYDASLKEIERMRKLLNLQKSALGELSQPVVWPWIKLVVLFGWIRKMLEKVEN